MGEKTTASRDQLLIALLLASLLGRDQLLAACQASSHPPTGAPPQHDESSVSATHPSSPSASHLNLSRTGLFLFGMISCGVGMYQVRHGYRLELQTDELQTEHPRAKGIVKRTIVSI